MRKGERKRFCKRGHDRFASLTPNGKHCAKCDMIYQRHYLRAHPEIMSRRLDKLRRNYSRGKSSPEVRARMCEAKVRLQGQSRMTATQHMQEWTLDDITLMVENRRELTAKQLALKLKRTVYAVEGMRKRLKHGLLPKRVGEIVPLKDKFLWPEDMAV